MNDLRKAAERLLKALDDGWVQRDDWVAFELRQALAQPEQEHQPWCDSLNIMLTSLPPQKAKCNCKQAQPEQEPVAYLDAVDNKTVYVAPNRKSWLDPHEDKEWLQFHYDHCHDTPLYTAPPSNLEKEKESTAQTVDPRLLLGRSNNFTKETENRLCDIERRLAAIETQHAPPSKPAERNENG